MVEVELGVVLSLDDVELDDVELDDDSVVCEADDVVSDASVVAPNFLFFK